MNKTLCIFLILTTIYARAQESIRLPQLKKQIDSLASADKKAGQDMRTGKIEQRDSLRKIVQEIFKRNTEVAKQIFNRYGFPDYDLVGKESSDNFWLCVQHSDADLQFQQVVLNKMKRAVISKKADKSNFAFLTDRVNINLGKQQIYGTQLDYDEHKTAFPKNLWDPKNVNKRRKSIGLEPIEEYLEFATQAHRQMNPDK